MELEMEPRIVDTLFGELRPGDVFVHSGRYIVVCVQVWVRQWVVEVMTFFAGDFSDNCAAWVGFEKISLLRLYSQGSLKVLRWVRKGTP